MALRPLADNLLVRGDPKTDEYVTTEGKKLAVDIDPNAQLPVGTILAVGHNLDPNVFRVGTRIVYRQYCGEKVFLYDDEGRLIPNMLIVKFEDVLGYDDGDGKMSLPKEKDA